MLALPHTREVFVLSDKKIVSIVVLAFLVISCITVTAGALNNPKTALACNPHLKLSKSAVLINDADSNGRLSPGDTLKYTLTYENDGDYKAANTSLTDDYDETLIDSVTAISGGGTLGSGKIVWNLGTLPAGPTHYTQTYNAKLKGNASFQPGDTDLKNTALIKDIPTGITAEAKHTEVVTKIVADLNIEKTAVRIVDADSNGRLSPGDTLKYTITYWNAGPTKAPNVVLTDDYDETLIDPPTAISGGGTLGSGKIVWNLGELPAGPTHYTQTYEAKLKGNASFAAGDTDLINKATIVETETGNKDDVTHTEVVTKIVPQPGLKIEKKGPISVAVGQMANYTITVTNTGNATLHNVRVVDTKVGLDETIGSLGVGESREFTPSYGPVTANDAPKIHNKATATCDEIPEPASSEVDVAVTVQAARKVLGSKGWFLAEGSTGVGFDTWILIQNPGTEKANVEVTFMTQDGSRAPLPVSMEAKSRATIRINDYVPNDFHVSTMVTSDVPVMADRSMYWDKRFPGEGSVPGNPQPYEMKGGHSNIGTTLESITSKGNSGTGRTITDFPEGSTAGGFDTWILLCNPNNREAITQLTFSTTKGIAAQNAVKVPPYSRRTVHLNEIVPDAFEVATEITSDAPIVAERSMYWDPNMKNIQPYEAKGGHSSSGSSSPAKEWFLAEGSTGEGFETYVLVQNPQDASAHVVATFMNAERVAAEKSFDMAPHSRATLRISDYVPNDFHVSTKVTADQGIVAERSMYWDKRAVKQTWEMRDGHSSIGVSSLGTTWMIAEGSTGIGFDTWILLSNPGDVEANASVTFMNAEGPRAPINVKIPPRSRSTIRISDYMPNDFHVSTLIESNTPLVAERSMYWDKREAPGIQPYEMMGGHSALGLDP